MITRHHNADFCVIGGGLSGICAAVSAARKGLSVVLVHDRPVLGGNASSEIRMWVCGAHGNENREGGLIEEILLDNLYFNSQKSYAMWDAVLYNKVVAEANITLLLNTSVNSATMNGKCVESVGAWQGMCETTHIISAPLFADCSGDGILAPLSGANFRMGREARAEFNEDIEPEKADNKTMGLSCLLQARETASKKIFRPPPFANVYPDDSSFPNRPHELKGMQNFWWIETGGNSNTIHDADKIRQELLKIVYGVWDHIKNRGDHGADNWVLEWVGFLPGKRESRRYVGDHIITQNDVRAGGKFVDVVGYAGWSMDDHHPSGFNHPGQPTIFHPAPSPWGIPYRSLYSNNIKNLLFAGRNISATHAAMSSSRVMATCAMMGQAIGTAASICRKYDCLPKTVYDLHIKELQKILIHDDVYLPGISLKEETIKDSFTKRFETPENIESIRLIFDSSRDQMEKNMPALRFLYETEHRMPSGLVKSFNVEIESAEGNRELLFSTTENYHRFVKVPVKRDILSYSVNITAFWNSYP